jgi:mRNA interferase RelE/StbE
MYNVSFKKSALKELQKLQNREKLLITKAIKELENDPRPHSCKKLVCEDITYRIRVGNYRVVYNIYENELIVNVIRVRHRKDVYR